jgi:chemotaxis regulatin CheY-phosphate phosphatase CheZ
VLSCTEDKTNPVQDTSIDNSSILEKDDTMTTKSELIDILFWQNYHSQDLTVDLPKYLRETFPAVESKHLDAMHHFIDVIRRSKSASNTDSIGDNIPGMVYGFLCDAWRQFKEEQNIS